jgi:5'-nucleotidase
MRILISNDDGVHAPGLKALYKELRKLGEVWVVAPLEEKSTNGHSLTLHKPLRIIPIDDYFYGVSGSPADCIYLGIREVLKGKKPDWVVSGINRGANLGQDIYYSGTVSAAREAAILKIPSMAVSLSVDFHNPPPEVKLHYSTAGKIALKMIQKLSSGEMKLPVHTLLNLNVPDLALSKVKGIQVVQQGFRHYNGAVVKRRDHRGKDYYWVGGQYRGFKKDVLTDCYWVERGYASLTPMKLDVTDTDSLDALRELWPKQT